MQKSYFDVLGICCSSEIPLIERILKPLNGIEKVSVSVSSKTVIVVHDNLIISQLQIVKALNQARLEASPRDFGKEKKGIFWPSPYTMASGILLILSFMKFLYHPLHWLALGAAAVGLPPIILRSIAAIRSITLDINILVLVAVGGTIALKDYREAGLIVFLFTIAEWLESRASYKARSVMSSLMSMAPQTAVLAESGLSVDIKDVKIGTIIAVKAGEVIPIDGIVVEGRSEVDEKTLTGESFPVEKQVQSTVWAGTMNLNGYISVKTTALSEDSAVARMAKLVEEAQHNQSKTQRFIDTAAKYYTPSVVLVSAGFAVVPAALRSRHLNHWLRLALVLLVSACPCALVLSTPVATFCALSKAATMGLLIKGGDYLETLARIRVVAFDKTGTITRGEFTVTDFRSVSSDIDLSTLLYWVSSIESKSSHPMAGALVEYSRSNSIEPKTENVEDFQILPGEGIFGKIDGKNIHVGNRRIASKVGCGIDLEGTNQRGVTVGYVFLDAILVGIFTLSDNCRSGAASAINDLKSIGIKIAMLTGDSREAAMHVQEQLGHAIEVVHAELLPEDKVRIVKELKTTEGLTAMVGDGMNDAPALAAADVGISMSISASAVATESAHVTLMSNDIGKITEAIRLGRRTRRKIIENVAISIATKVAILALAFAGHPLLWAAVVSDVGTCLLVILNSMLLLRGATRASKHCESSHAHQHHHVHNHGHENRGKGFFARGKCDSGDCGSGEHCGHSKRSHHHGHPSGRSHAQVHVAHESMHDGALTSGGAHSGQCNQGAHDHSGLIGHGHVCCSHGSGSHRDDDEGGMLALGDNTHGTCNTHEASSHMREGIDAMHEFSTCVKHGSHVNPVATCEPAPRCKHHESNKPMEHVDEEDTFEITCEPIHSCDRSRSTMHAGAMHTHVNSSHGSGLGMHGEQASDVHVTPHACTSLDPYEHGCHPHAKHGSMKDTACGTCDPINSAAGLRRQGLCCRSYCEERGLCCNGGRIVLCEIVTE